MKMAADYGNLLTSPASQTCWFPADVFCFSCLNAKYWSSLISFYRKLFLNSYYFNDLFLQIHLPFHLHRVIFLFKIFSHCIYGLTISEVFYFMICVVYAYNFNFYFYRIIFFVSSNSDQQNFYILVFLHYHDIMLHCRSKKF